MSRAKLDLADFHIGNLTDFWSLSYTLDKAVAKLRKYGIGRVDLVLLGDIHDYQNMYPTQVSLTKGVWQAYGAAGLVDWMVEKLKSRGVSVDKIVIVEGNHDRCLHEGISLTGYLVQALEKIGFRSKVEVYSSAYIDVNGVLYTHSILQRSLGSYIYGISPRMIREANKLTKRYKVHKIITGHVHKFGMVRNVHGWVVTIPSFQIDLSKKEDDRGGALVMDGEDVIPVEPDKALAPEEMDENLLYEKVLEELVEYIKRYWKKSLIPYRACAIKVLYIGLPKKEEGKVWWKLSLIHI